MVGLLDYFALGGRPPLFQWAAADRTQTYRLPLARQEATM
jgi:hypothetical protein